MVEGESIADRLTEVESWAVRQWAMPHGKRYADTVEEHVATALHLEAVSILRDHGIVNPNRRLLETMRFTLALSPSQLVDFVERFVERVQMAVAS